MIVRIQEGQAAHLKKFIGTEKARNGVHKGQKILQNFQQNMEAGKRFYMEIIRSLWHLQSTFLQIIASYEYFRHVFKEWPLKPHSN